MGVKKFSVIYDKPDRVYHPGEMVTGRVELVLDSRLKIRGIKLQIKGKAECKFSEKASETYVNIKQLLMGGIAFTKLPVGEHVYPFTVRLPLKAPSSFSHYYGKILYYGRAKIDIPLTFDIKERSEFTVINPLNLNLFPNLRTPEEKTTFSDAWSSCGQVTIVFRLPKTGFATFETIPLTLKVENASDAMVNAVQVYLKRIIYWTVKETGFKSTKKRQHNSEIELQKLHLGGVAAGQSHTWNENFVITSISFPNVDGCSIIKIDHELHIEANASGGHRIPDMHIPIIIGDIPLSEDPNAPIQNCSAERLAYLYPNLNPPLRSHPDFRNISDAPFEEPPIQICPSAPLVQVVSQPRMNNTSTNYDFVAPNSYRNSEKMSQIPIQENSIPFQQYQPQAPTAYPSLPAQSTTNSACFQNAPHNSLVVNADVGDRAAFHSFKNDVQLEKTLDLSDSKEDGEHVVFELPFFTDINQSGIDDHQNHRLTKSQDNLDELSAQLVRLLDDLDRVATDF